MENKKGISIVLLIPAIIIGVALFNEFDFESYKFKNPALAFVYFLGFALSIFFQFRGSNKGSKE
ncbi:MAG: hypothetical protein KDC79_12995 [Cyclobacteriaceae bacterium]|nr:hypothetical protein [Cyclobacteriaceae bacterium]